MSALNAASLTAAAVAVVWALLFFGRAELRARSPEAWIALPLLVLPSVRRVPYSLRAGLLVFAFASLPLVSGMQTGASVAASVGGVGGVLLAGVFFGFRAAVVVWIATALGFAVGLEVASVSTSYDPSFLDARIPQYRQRMLGTFVGLSAPLALGIVALVARLSRALRESETSRNAEALANERRQQALRQAVEAQKFEVMGQMAGSIAHDVNNSLQVIMSFAELMSLEPPDAAGARKVGSDMFDVCEQAAKLARQLLTLGQQQILDLEAIDLASIVDKMEHTLRRSVPSNITLLLELKAGCIVEVDKTQLRQALLNLTINAAHAMVDGGTLKVQVRPLDDARVEIAVEDTGTGMDVETQAHAFEPFFTTKGSAGTGLGLPSVKAFAEQHGGEATLESQLGVGTRVSLRLPRVDAKAAALVSAPPMAGDLVGLTVLVAEDDPRVRRAIVKGIEAAGATAYDVADVTHALEIVEKRRVDVLCTDAIMPGRPVRELIERFGALCPGAPVIVCSGYVESELLRRGIQTRELSFLAKPFSVQELIAKIRQALARARVVQRARLSAHEPNHVA